MCQNSSMLRIRNVGGVRTHPFFYVPAVLKVVTNGNGTGTKNFLKGTVRFCLSLVSTHLSLRRFYYHQYFSTQTNLVYLGLGYVTMITGTHN